MSPQIPSPQMPTSFSKKLKRASKTISDVWLWFTKYEALHHDQENNPSVMIQKADFKYYDKKGYSAKNTGNTSHLKRHMEDCKKNQDPVQTLFSRSPIGNITSFGFNQDVARAELVRFIVVDEQTFSFSEKDAFKRFIRKTYGDIFQPPSRNIVKADIFKFYKIEKEDLKIVLQNTPGKISPTSDLWSSPIKLGFCCVTLHFLDST
ncbi:hypothetical protein GIB67_036481 [Kingdonia uniflora]|uniref:Uncharacterized protein n=1 Tax=Kingdonia uniflora TaxID=39325 RepID=A0A7J7P7S4_9MAGN|nr:hypothetical protein GIB67_036481 [Kingdonia uniflora]